MSPEAGGPAVTPLVVPAVDARPNPNSRSPPDEVPGWVRLACDRWGRQKRRIWAGGDWYIDGEGLRRHHADGYAQSFLGRLLAERDGAGQGARSQHWPEVLWGDALDVQRNILGMPITCFEVLHLKYVFDPEWGLTVANKAALISLKVWSYWDSVGRAEWWLYARLQRGPEYDLGVSVSTGKSVTHGSDTGNELRRSPKERKRSGHSSNLPKLTLEALERPTLTLPRR